MATARRLKKQADRCAALARQTQDEEARRRYIRLERLYLNLAEAEDSTAPARIESAA